MLYNHIILEMFFFCSVFAVQKIRYQIASKILKQNTCINKLLKKQNSASVEASP